MSQGKKRSFGGGGGTKSFHSPHTKKEKRSMRNYYISLGSTLWAPRTVGRTKGHSSEGKHADSRLKMPKNWPGSINFGPYVNRLSSNNPID